MYICKININKFNYVTYYFIRFMYILYIIIIINLKFISPPLDCILWQF